MSLEAYENVIAVAEARFAILADHDCNEQTPFGGQFFSQRYAENTETLIARVAELCHSTMRDVFDAPLIRSDKISILLNPAICTAQVSGGNPTYKVDISPDLIRVLDIQCCTWSIDANVALVYRNSEQDPLELTLTSGLVDQLSAYGIKDDWQLREALHIFCKRERRETNLRFFAELLVCAL